MRQLGLGIVFKWFQENARVPETVQSNLNGISGAAKQAKANFAAMGLALAALSAGVVGLGSTAGEFQRDLARVANISGATSDELGQLRDAAIQAGIETQFSPREAVAGLGALAAQGFTTTESMKFLGNSLDLAAGGMIGIEQASRTTAAAIRVFGENAGDTATVADRLLKITNLTSLQANDLALALGTVSRGAGLTKQNLDEMLVSMGLVRNSGVDASVAASSVSSALVMAAKNADKFKSKLGLSVTDASGQFKDFLDIVVEFDQKASKRFSNAAERAAVTTELFGKFGTTAVQNVSEQLKALVRNRDDIETVEEAIAFMRAQLAGAEGTAKQFAAGLNDTFAGAVTLLGGTIETLAIVIGEPIANALKPVIQGLTQALNFLLVAFNDLPGPVKTVFGILAIGVGAVAALGAAGIAAAGAYTLLAPAVSAAATVVAGFVVAALPVIATIGLIGGAVALLVVGVRENFMGLGDLWDNTVGRIVLLTKSLIQLFSSGELSGSVLDELNKVENSGIKRFAITLFQVGFRIKRFFQGIVQGLTETLGPPIRRIGRVFVRLGTAMGRVFSAVLGVFTRIGQALGLVSKKGAEAAAKTPSASFFNAALKVARVFGTVLGFTLDLVTMVVDAVAFGVELIATGLEKLIELGDEFGVFEAIADFIIEQFRRVADFVEGVFEFILDAIDTVKTVAEIAADPAGSAKSFVQELTTGKVGRLIVAQQTGGSEAVREQLAEEVTQQQQARQTSFAEVTQEGQGRIEARQAELLESLRRMADREDRPINVTVTTPSGEVLFEQTQQGAAESQARTFDVTSAPL